MPVNGLAIKLIGFDSLESDYFTAILDLAEALLHQEWQVVTAETPDFFVFSEEGLKSGLSPDAPPARCFFYSAENTSDKHIAVNNRVPSLHSLVGVLNRAGANFQSAEDVDGFGLQQSTAPSPVFEDGQAGRRLSEMIADAMAVGLPDVDVEYGDGSASLLDDSLFKPSQGLLKALLNRDNNPVWLAVAGVDIWLDPAHGLYYCLVALEGLVPCCGADKRVETHAMTALELQQLVAKQNIPPKPLNNLIWYLVFKTSQGRLLEGNSDEDIVHLKGWPNLRLPEGRDFIKLAAFMHNNSMPLPAIAEATRLPLEQVHNFYNACYLVGLIEKVGAVQRHERTTSVERQNLLGKLRNRLNMQ